MLYRPGDLPPGSLENPLYMYLQGEMTKIAQAIASSKQTMSLDVLSKAPEKPRDGMIVLADGASWNPGSGRGFYGYSNAAWRFLG